MIRLAEASVKGLFLAGQGLCILGVIRGWLPAADGWLGRTPGAGEPGTERTIVAV